MKSELVGLCARIVMPLASTSADGEGGTTGVWPGPNSCENGGAGRMPGPDGGGGGPGPPGGGASVGETEDALERLGHFLRVGVREPERLFLQGTACRQLLGSLLSGHLAGQRLLLLEDGLCLSA